MLKWNIVIPEWQRNVDMGRVNDIYSYIVMTPPSVSGLCAKSLQHYIPIQTGIYMCTVPSPVSLSGKIYHLIDGNHRLSAFKRIYEETKIDVEVLVHIYSATDDADMYRVVKIINNTRPFEMPETPQLCEIIRQVVDEMALRYVRYFSNSERTKRPHVFVGEFSNKLVKYYTSQPVHVTLTKEVILEELELLNTIYRNQFRTAQLLETLRARYKDDGDKVRKWVKEGVNVFFIGFFKGLDCLDDIKGEIAAATPEEKSKNGGNISQSNESKIGERPKRKPFTRVERRRLWNSKKGDSLKGQCDLCNSDVNYDTFEMGHRTSVKNGGSNNLDNVMVLCSACNREIGSANI